MHRNEKINFCFPPGSDFNVNKRNTQAQQLACFLLGDDVLACLCSYCARVLRVFTTKECFFAAAWLLRCDSAGFRRVRLIMRT